jgi:hypothetical protein
MFSGKRQGGEQNYANSIQNNLTCTGVLYNFLSIIELVGEGLTHWATHGEPDKDQRRKP